MKFAKYLTLMLALAIAFAPAALQARDQQPPAPLVPKFAEGSASDVIAADIFDTIIYLPVNIDGRGPYSFVLDTGNGGTPVLDEKLARALGVPLGKRFEITGGAGSTPTTLYQIDGLDLGLPGLGFSDVPAATLPLELMDPHWGKHKDGLIGGTVFSVAITDIDYAKKTVRFSNPKTFTPPAGEVIPIEVFGQPFVRAKVYLYGSSQPVEAFLMVDTGVRVTTFNSPFSVTNKLAEQSPKTLATMTGFGINGASWGVIGRVRAIELGSIRIENPVVDFSTDKAGALASDQFAGILGADILRRFHVVFDYPGGRMFLEKNADFGAPFEFDMSGLRLVAEGKAFDVIKVFHVADKTPAQAAGLLAGDEIRTIDGRKASTFDWETMRTYFQRPRQTVKLEVIRDGKTIPISLTLERLV
jgi:predicted aspartyl protease